MVEFSIKVNNKVVPRGTGLSKMHYVPSFRTARLFWRLKLFSENVTPAGTVKPLNFLAERSDLIAATKAVNAVNDYLRNLHFGYFQRERGPDGKKWARNSKRYLAWKTRSSRSRRYGTKPGYPDIRMTMTRQLQESLRFGGTANNDEYEFGPDPAWTAPQQQRRPWSKSHLKDVQRALHKGRTSGILMPARPFVGTKQSNARDFVRRSYWNTLLQGIRR